MGSARGTCTHHTAHLTPHTAHLAHHTAHLTPHTSHSSPHTSHSSPHTSYITQLTSHITQLTSHSSPHTSHITQLTPHSPTHHSPLFDERNVNSSTSTSRAKVEWSWSPEKSYSIGRVVCVERSVAEERLHICRQDKAVIFLWLRLSNLVEGRSQMSELSHTPIQPQGGRPSNYSTLVAD